ncbi:hypothetical protein AVEN_166014-1 [Araneus ventricosus]|uniref:Uncharacterized protein n=1 Tax=Araneus ventricosus TaxID=182803 RepID=A0A4Y2L4B3_ARAVE|nr:hypothetical protein AVEN_166014-1 [Araneus ventricosus]
MSKEDGICRRHATTRSKKVVPVRRHATIKHDQRRWYRQTPFNSSMIKKVVSVRYTINDQRRWYPSDAKRPSMSKEDGICRRHICINESKKWWYLSDATRLLLKFKSSLLV